MGDSVSTMFAEDYSTRGIRVPSQRRMSRIYAAAGTQALAWVHSLTGKMLMRAGHVSAGREHLSAALKYDFRPSYAVYYFVALVFPAAFFKIIHCCFLKTE